MGEAWSWKHRDAKMDESLREVQTALDPRLDFTTAWVGAFKERAKPLAQV